MPEAYRFEPVFLVYSITKTFTATLILLLQEEQRLSLDDTVFTWFPRITEAQHISVRMVLNHTAGIPDYSGLGAYHEAIRSSPSVPWLFERFVAETINQGLTFAPGTGWAYSNPGYMLLKRIAEQTGGATFADLIRDRIAMPLGLGNTFVPESIEALSPLAPAVSGELTQDRSTCDVRTCYHPGWVSHGVVASTASDIVRFIDALFDGRLISTQSLKEMTMLVPVPMKPSVQTNGRKKSFDWGKPSYGLGIMGDPESPWGRLWGHNGGGPGYSASAFHAPDLGGVSVCAMGSTEEVFRTEQLVIEVLDMIRH
jgi:D-alanyl-D-alanine carboxypeptidase